MVPTTIDKKKQDDNLRYQGRMLTSIREPKNFLPLSTKEMSSDDVV